MIFVYNIFFFSTATNETFAINFLCDQSSYPGSLKLVQEEMSTLASHVTHYALFEFSTALACEPAPVYCKTSGMNPDSHHPSWQTKFFFFFHNTSFFLMEIYKIIFFADPHGNEYDLSQLIRDADDSPWIPIDTDAGTSRRFYINICKPLPTVQGCPG